MSPAAALLLAALAAPTTTAAPGTPAPAARVADKAAYNRHTGLFEPPFGELERAVGRGDRADIARWASRIGLARLAEALRGGERPRVIAALEAMSLLPGNVRLLDAVTPLVASSDLSIAERAARGVGQLLDGAEPRRLEDWDIPADAVARGCRALNDVTLRTTAPVEVRLAALDALADALLLCRPVPLALLGDPLPAIRRAALLAQRPRDELPAQVLKQGLADPDPGVVAAAAVAWCRNRLVAPAKPAGTQSPRDLPPLRELAAAGATPVEDALEMVPCLATSTEAADRMAAEKVRRTRTPPARPRAADQDAAPGR
jgi:hypothetical protein